MSPKKPKTPLISRNTGASVASTPNSMLRSEMELQEQDEEPMLFSPAVALCRNVSKRAPKEVPTTGSTKEASQLSVDISLPPEPVPLDEPCAFVEEKTSPAEAAATHSAVSKPLAQMLPKVSSTPFTPRGVCMDLSMMFSGAKSHSKRPPLAEAARRPPISTTTKRPVTTPLIVRAEHEWDERQCDTFTAWLNHTFHPDDLQSDSAHHALISHQRMAQARLKALYLFNSMTKVRDVLAAEITRGKIKLRPDRDLCVDLTMQNSVIDLLFSFSIPWLRLALETCFGETILPEEPYFVDDNSANKAVVDRIRKALRHFIVHQVLADDKTLAKYTKGKCKVPSGSFEKKYRAEMRTLVLYRLIVVFFFLDRAKHEELLDKAPRLFTKKTSIKSSRDLLLCFCRNFLSAEGDFVKHLSRVGLKATYTQDVYDEVDDYHVKNLAVDLRDGVRFARLLEILENKPHKTYLHRLRLPAVSRLQKLHNIGFVLDHLTSSGFETTGIAKHHIVDGHREMVMKLMWSILTNCCLTKLVDPYRLNEEIARISRDPSHMLPPTDDVNEEYLSSLLLRWSQSVAATFGIDVSNLSSDMADGRVFCFLIHLYHPTTLKLRDIRRGSDAGHYNIALANRAMRELGGIPNTVPTPHDEVMSEKAVLLCLSYMSSRILESSLQVKACLVLQRAYRCRLQARRLFTKRYMAKRILRVWRRNKDNYFRSIRLRYAHPVAVIEDFVWARRGRLAVLARHRHAMDKYSNATVLIQSTFRRYHQQMKFQALKEDQRAQEYLRALRVTTACRSIQRHFREYLQRKESRTKAATMIQATFRSFFAQVQYQVDLLDVRTVQARVRGFIARQQHRARKEAFGTIRRALTQHALRRRLLKFLEVRRQSLAAVKCQAVVRRAIVRMRCREVQLQQSEAAMKIQTTWKSSRCKISYERVRSAAVFVQTWWRAASTRARFVKNRSCATKVQASARRWLSQQRAMKLTFARDQLYESSASTIQSVARTYFIRHELLLLNAAAVSIQAMSRGFLARIETEIHRLDIVLVQSIARAWSQRRKFLLHKDAALSIQRCLRAKRMQRIMTMKLALLRQEIAATKIQATARRLLAKRLCVEVSKVNAHAAIQRFVLRCIEEQRFARMAKKREEYTAAVLIQSVAIGFVARRKTRRQLAARLIQKTWRCYTVHVDFLLYVLASIQVQSAFRRYLARKSARLRRAAVMTIQRFGRAYLALCEEVELRRIAVTTIQRFTRGCFVRQGLQIMDFACVEAQRIWRGYHARQAFQIVQYCSVRVQATARGYLTRKRVNMIREELVCQNAMLRFATRRIQRAARRSLERVRLSAAAVQIQRFVRSHQSKNTFVLLKRRVSSLQALARGAQRRRTLSEEHRAILLRLRRATDKCRLHPELRLGNRTIAALSVLQESTSLSEIMSVLRVLEISTRLSKSCCEAFAAADAPNILFTLATTCNRSVPHTEVIHYTMLTMLNVSRHDELIPSIASTAGLEVCLDIVQMFRDKIGVFVAAVVVLEYIIRFSDDLQAHCGSRENVKRLKGVFTLCRRKLSLPDTNRSLVLGSHNHRNSVMGRRSTNMHHKKISLFHRPEPDLKQGVRTLQRIIRLVDNEP